MAILKIKFSFHCLINVCELLPFNILLVIINVWKLHLFNILLVIVKVGKVVLCFDSHHNILS
jgi:hypothetical protein